MLKKNSLAPVKFDEEKKAKGGIGTLYWLYQFAAEHRRLLIIGIFLSILTVGFNLIPPYMLKLLIDNVILSSTHSQALFIEFTVILLLAYLASTIVSAFQNYVLNIAGNRVVTSIRKDLFRHAVRLSATEVDNVTPSRIQSRLISDAGNTQWLMTYGLTTVITSALTIIGIG